MVERLAAWICAVLCSAGLAGCLGDEGDDETPPTNDPGPTAPGPHTLIIREALTAGELANATLFDFRGVGFRAFEPTMGVTTDGTIFFVAGTRVLRSDDLGVTWTEVGPRVGDRSLPPTTLDPYLYVDVPTGRVFDNQLTLECSFLAFSDDEGATWTYNPHSCGAPVNDHQTLAAGPTALPSTWQGRVVLFCSNQFADATCAPSLDGGQSFLPARAAFAPEGGVVCEGGEDPTRTGPVGGITGHVVFDADGAVFLPAWRCDEPWISVSEDSGQTWRARRVSERTSGAMDPSVAVDAEGNVYYFWMDVEGLPLLAVSRDAGETWDEPIDVAFPGLKTATLPSIVAGDAGRIAFTYVAVSNGTAKPPQEVSGDTAWNLYVTLSTDILDAAPHFTTVQVNPADDPVHKGVCEGGYRCGDIADFMDIVAGPDGRVFVASVDGCATQACVGHRPAEGSPAESDGILGVLVQGPSLLKDHEGFTA